MIGSTPRDPNYYSKNPELLDGDRKVCAFVMLTLGTIVTILYFTIGGGSK
jgi:hypothetical protein